MNFTKLDKLQIGNGRLFCLETLDSFANSLIINSSTDNSYRR